RDHRLATLVHAGVAHEDHAPAGAAGQRPHLDHLGPIRDRVADIDRLKPFEVAEAGRRPEPADRLAARTELPVLARAVGDHEPHPNAGGVPARGAEPAEMRARGGRLVEMERLRIEARGEGLDVLGGEGVAAELAHLADANILEEFHDLLAAFGSPPPAALAARRPNIGLTIKVITGWWAALISSKRNLTKAVSGRWRGGRVSSTAARALMRSPGRTGASHFTSSTPGAPMKLASPRKSSLSMRISTQQVCHPEATRPPNKVARAAASSRCMGCGSYSAAKPTISARVMSRDPHSVPW